MKARGYIIASVVGAAIAAPLGVGFAYLIHNSAQAGSWWQTSQGVDLDSAREANAFIMLSEDSFLKEDMQAHLALLEQRRYQDARSAHDLYVYAAFLEDFPESQHSEAIEAILRENADRMTPVDGGDYPAAQMGAGEAP